jgi:hypothetical protein
MAKDDDHLPPIELDPPADALDARQAVEVMRVWVADGHMHLTFQADSFSHDVSEWGRLLADVAHHIARGVALSSDLTEREALTMVSEAFERGVAGGSKGAGRLTGKTRH